MNRALLFFSDSFCSLKSSFFFHLPFLFCLILLVEFFLLLEVPLSHRFQCRIASFRRLVAISSYFAYFLCYFLLYNEQFPIHIFYIISTFPRIWESLLDFPLKFDGVFLHFISSLRIILVSPNLKLRYVSSTWNSVVLFNINFIDKVYIFNAIAFVSNYEMLFLFCFPQSGFSIDSSLMKTCINNCSISHDPFYLYLVA